MESLLLVRNKKSGLVDRETLIRDGVEMLKQKGFTVHIVFIQDILSKELFEKKINEYHPKTIIAVGGDGTVNLLAQYLVHTDMRLAVVPAGTFNHFAKHIGIGTDVPAAFSNVISGDTQIIDTAEINNKIFVNFSSIGFYTQLIKRRVGYQKLAWRKWPAFIIALYESFINYASFEFEIKKNDSVVAVKTPLIFIGNNIFDFGSADILAGRKDFQSGKLHISIAKEMGRWGIVWLALRSMLIDIKYKPGFTTIALDELEIRSKKPVLSVSLDGEIEKIQTPLTYKILPTSLKVIVPRDYNS